MIDRAKQSIGTISNPCMWDYEKPIHLLGSINQIVQFAGAHSSAVREVVFSKDHFIDG